MKNNLSFAWVCLFLFVSLMLPYSSFGSSINYSADSYESVIQKSKSQNKYFFVKFSAHWCTTCKVMDESANNNPTLVSFVNENFLPVKADMDSSVGKQWKDQLNVCCLPTLVVFTPDGNELGRNEGGIPSSEFLSFLENAVGKKAPIISQPAFVAQPSRTVSTYSTPQPKFVSLTPKGEIKNSSKWTLLIAQHTQLKEANIEIKKLKQKLTDDIILNAKKENNKMLYQVSIGNITSEQEAIRLRKKLQSKNIRCSLIKE